MKRMWINQPSTLQKHHDLNGVRVLVVEPKGSERTLDVYFTSGPVISMQMERLTLSEGWPESTRTINADFSRPLLSDDRNSAAPPYTKQQSDFEDAILDLIDNRDDYTRSGLQRAVSAIVMRIQNAKGDETK